MKFLVRNISSALMALFPLPISQIGRMNKNNNLLRMLNYKHLPHREEWEGEYYQLKEEFLISLYDDKLIHNTEREKQNSCLFIANYI